MFSVRSDFHLSPSCQAAYDFSYEAKQLLHLLPLQRSARLSPPTLTLPLSPSHFSSMRQVILVWDDNQLQKCSMNSARKLKNNKN